MFILFSIIPVKADGLFKQDPSYFLVFDWYSKKKSIDLYKEPLASSPSLKKHTLGQDLYENFTAARTLMDGHEIVAFKKSGDFYLLEYQGERVWVNKKDFKDVQPSEEYFKKGKKHRSLAVDVSEALVFDEKFKRLKKEDIWKMIPNDELEKMVSDTFIFTVLKLKRKNGKLWMYGNLCGRSDLYYETFYACLNHVKGVWVQLFDKGKARGWTKHYPKLE